MHTAPTSQDCLMHTRSAADLDSHPPMPVHSSVTATVTLVFLLLFQSPSQLGLAWFPSQAQPFRVGSLTVLSFQWLCGGLKFSRTFSRHSPSNQKITLLSHNLLSKASIFATNTSQALFLYHIHILVDSFLYRPRESEVAPLDFADGFSVFPEYNAFHLHLGKVSCD